MKIHLVDGTYELFRNYFGTPLKKAHTGQEVGGTLGLLRSLLMLLTSPGVTHVGVAFDHMIESFRNDLYAGYKTGEGVDPNLLAQFPLAEKAVSALGVVVWPMVKFEADDALATAVARYKRANAWNRSSFARLTRICLSWWKVSGSCAGIAAATSLWMNKVWPRNLA